MRWKQTVIAVGAFLLGGVGALYAAGPPLGSGPVVPLDITANAVPLNPADPAAERVGQLIYHGGLVLTASDRRFGGISSLEWDAACGRFLAVTDTGAWIILEPREEAGRLIGIGNAWIAPILGMEGRPPLRKADADAEASARMADGDLWVFYEQQHRGERFQGVSACRPDSLSAVPVARWAPAAAQGWPANGGIEAAASREGRLILLSEGAPAAAGGRQGLDAVPGSDDAILFAYQASLGHEATALAPLAPGASRMLVLNRHFSPLTGVSVILSAAGFPVPVPATVQPAGLARLAPPYTIDNMEGMAVRTEAGRTFIYLVSDDNFNPAQRTLLMKFELAEPDAPKP